VISNQLCESVGGPEKGGVGGSIPSLATNPFNHLGSAKARVKISRANNTRTSVADTLFLAPLVQNKLPRFSRRAAGPTNVLPRQLDMAFRHPDIRVAQDLRHLVKMVYDEPRRFVHQQMRREHQPYVLQNYSSRKMRQLVDQSQACFENRNHFVAIVRA
jgi:hypothetical protein